MNNTLSTDVPTPDTRQLSQVIFEYAGRVGREQNREALIETIANMGRDLVGADRCTVWLVDEATRTLRARFAHGPGVIPIGANQGFVGHCVATGTVTLSNAPADDPRFASIVDQHTGYRTTSVLTVPMRTSEGTIIGAFQAVNKPGGFADADADLLGLAAVYSAHTLETQALLQKAEAARRVERELDIARDVQQRLLAGSHARKISGVDFDAVCRPALKVGGDFYDVMPLPSNRMAIAFGDISGKGVAAALMMATLQATLHGLVLRGVARPSAIVAGLNETLIEASVGHYSTLFFALYDFNTRRLTAVNAGHCAPLIVGAHGTVREIESSGPPVGLLPHAVYEQQDVVLAPGETLVCYSDGLSEAQNGEGAFWSERGMQHALRAAAAVRSGDAVARVMQEADRFVAGAPQSDDMTILCLLVTH